jgi:hypothetical protein
VSRALAENLGRRMWRVFVGRNGEGWTGPRAHGYGADGILGASDRQGPSAVDGGSVLTGRIAVDCARRVTA